MTQVLKQGISFTFMRETETIIRDLVKDVSDLPVLVFTDSDAVEDDSRSFQVFVVLVGTHVG